ncbi:MAG: glycosyltransferase [Microbacterium sp.]|nr:glycosyltransferase [Microbacterium sp.]
MRPSTGDLDVLVVCPTPTGGHMEQAAELALAAAALGKRVGIATRPGAIDDLPAAVPAVVEVLEVLPPLPPRGGALGYAGPLIREHGRLRRLSRRLAPGAVVAVEEPRYPFARAIVRGGRRDVRVVGLLHNAIDHAAGSRRSVDRVRQAIAARFARSADSVVVHGERQAEVVRAAGIESVRVLRLPTFGRLHVQDQAAIPSHAACLGELRPNKGIEIAIAAARAGGAELVVAGAPIDDGYLAELQALAAAAPSVTLIPGFMSGGELDARTRGAGMVVLPYASFAAQSAILGRAMHAGTFVVCSDLPSLREQLGAYSRVAFFPPGDVAALAALLTVSREPPTAGDADGGDAHDYADWARYADAVVNGR